MSEIVLQADIREQRGKSVRHVRHDGNIPGIYYAHNEENINVSATPLALKPIIYSKDAHIVHLKLNNGVTKNCILRNVQYDPISSKPIHFDLQGVKEDEELSIEIPVKIIGSPKGVKDGGTLQHVIHRLRVLCLPKFIPGHVEVDVTELGINDSIHVRDLKIANVTILDSESSTVVGVVPPTVIKEEVPAAAVPAEGEAAAAPAEPEVIAKGKKPVEGEEIAPPAPKK